MGKGCLVLGNFSSFRTDGDSVQCKPSQQMNDPHPSPRSHDDESEPRTQYCMPTSCVRPFGTQLRTIRNQKQLRKHHVRHCVLGHQPPQREVPVLRHFLVPAVCCAAALQTTCYIALQAIARSCLQPRRVVQKRVLRPLELSCFEALSLHILNVCPLPTVSACETLLMLRIPSNGTRMPGPWKLLFI